MISQLEVSSSVLFLFNLNFVFLQILSFEMESDRQRWLDAVTPKLSENPNECIYEEWDCPQVIALYEFIPVQPDELNLCIGDVVNVLKKMSDGRSPQVESRVVKCTN